MDESDERNVGEESDDERRAALFEEAQRVGLQRIAEAAKAEVASQRGQPPGAPGDRT
jgi:hypothetical protein